MRKLLLFCMLLLIGVFSCACINSFAVYELNEKAVQMMEDGDVQGAIARWEASVDLDSNVYQSRYNLAAAYLRVGECEKALEQAKAAAELKKNEAVAFYTLGVAYDCAAHNIIETKDENGETVKKEFATYTSEKAAMDRYVEYLKEAVINYDKYITILPNAEDSKSVLSKINDLKPVIAEVEQKYSKPVGE